MSGKILAFILILLAFDLKGQVRAIVFYDLGYSINEDTIYYPGAKDFQLTKDVEGKNPTQGYWYASFSFCMGEHGGTHVDAPYHFAKNGWTVDKIPSAVLMDVPTQIIDVSEEVSALQNPSEFVLEVKHLISHEMKKGRLWNGMLVLIHTGWGKYWPDKSAYLGYDNSTAVTETADENGNGTKFTLNFPGISLNAAKWLADERGIVGIGLDTPSVDPGTSKTYPVHRYFAGKQIYAVENVANLHLHLDLSSCALRTFVMPLKIIGATGAPARVLAYCKNR